jgi:hypothetical protein
LKLNLFLLTFLQVLADIAIYPALFLPANRWLLFEITTFYLEKSGLMIKKLKEPKMIKAKSLVDRNEKTW